MVAVPPQIPTNLTQLKPERRRRETYALLLELADQRPDVVEEVGALGDTRRIGPGSYGSL
jgi:hypothetical protein